VEVATAHLSCASQVFFFLAQGANNEGANTHYNTQKKTKKTKKNPEFRSIDMDPAFRITMFAKIGWITRDYMLFLFLMGFSSVFGFLHRASFFFLDKTRLVFLFSHFFFHFPFAPLTFHCTLL
jgi:hypothetical protein